MAGAMLAGWGALYVKPVPGRPLKVIPAHREKDSASPHRRFALTAAVLAASVSMLCREVLARPCSVLCQ
jgi:hypothetical protein